MNLRAALQLRHLRALVAIADARHMGRAAQRLAISAPALSKTLRELEDLCGQALVLRGRGGARLASAGEALLPHALSALAAVAAAAASLQPGAETDARPALRLGTLPSVGPALVPQALQMHLGRVGGRVELLSATNEQLLNLLRAGKVDVAVGRLSDPAQMAGLSFEFLYADPLVFAVRPGHALLGEAASPAAGDLLERVLRSPPLVLAPQGTLPRHAAESLLKARGRSLPACRVETLAPSVARELCLACDAVWLTPQGAVRADLRRGLLVALPIDTRGSEEPVGLLLRSGGAAEPMRAEVAALADALRAAAALWRADPGDDHAMRLR